MHCFFTIELLDGGFLLSIHDVRFICSFDFVHIFTIHFVIKVAIYLKAFSVFL
jgi:hypothetical protein